MFLVQIVGICVWGFSALPTPKSPSKRRYSAPICASLSALPAPFSSCRHGMWRPRNVGGGGTFKSFLSCGDRNINRLLQPIGTGCVVEDASHAEMILPPPKGGGSHV